ncbi:MAG: metallopeptidase TldD-related protein, partial [Candidatus Ratteibacteria bacterium]
YGLDIVITRSTNNYGPYQHPEKFIAKTIIYALLNRKIPVYGTGRNVRDWLYVEDNCEAIDLVLHKGKKGEVYNIAGKQELKNIEVVKMILKLMNKPESLIEFVKDRPGHDLRYSLDISKIEKLGWKPKTKFEEGIKKTPTIVVENGELKTFLHNTYTSNKLKSQNTANARRYGFVNPIKVGPANFYLKPTDKSLQDL